METQRGTIDMKGEELLVLIDQAKREAWTELDFKWRCALGLRRTR